MVKVFLQFIFLNSFEIDNKIQITKEVYSLILYSYSQFIQNLNNKIYFIIIYI